MIFRKIFFSTDRPKYVVTFLKHSIYLFNLLNIELCMFINFLEKIEKFQVNT